MSKANEPGAAAGARQGRSRCAAPARGCVRLRRAALALLCCGACLGAGAQQQATGAGDDAALESRMLAIASELRCPVCQNETIAVSNAALAQDLRSEVRAMLRRGESREAILAHMSARYGDFVLYRPPLQAATALLWAGPALLLAGGALALLRALRRRGRLDGGEPEGREERAEPDA